MAESVENLQEQLHYMIFIEIIRAGQKKAMTTALSTLKKPE